MSLMGLGAVACAPATETGEDEDDDGVNVNAQESDLTGCLPLGLGPQVSGPVEQKYLSLGGCRSFLGPPVHGTMATPDGKGGLYAAFINGSIYWRGDLGAHVVRGEIRELWKAYGWESGWLGYPITDETVLADGGRFGVFENGSIYWTRRTGAHSVRGPIRDKWASLDWERGPLGYPTTEEFPVPGGVQVNFQRGAIIWLRDTSGEVRATF